MDNIKTDYKYIHFILIEEKPKTQAWSCRSSAEDELGQVRWYGSWRQYCFFPTGYGQLVFNDGCLKDIIHFMGQLKDAR